jgi:hypothetical protein
MFQKKYKGNETFNHYANGVWFHTTVDFSGGIKAFHSRNITPANLMKAVAEMVAFHTINVYPGLPSFGGYGGVVFESIVDGDYNTDTADPDDGKIKAGDGDSYERRADETK